MILLFILVEGSINYILAQIIELFKEYSQSNTNHL